MTAQTSYNETLDPELFAHLYQGYPTFRIWADSQDLQFDEEGKLETDITLQGFADWLNAGAGVTRIDDNDNEYTHYPISNRLSEDEMRQIFNTVEGAALGYLNYNIHHEFITDQATIDAVTAAEESRRELAAAVLEAQQEGLEADVVTATAETATVEDETTDLQSQLAAIGAQMDGVVFNDDNTVSFDLDNNGIDDNDLTVTAEDVLNYGQEGSALQPGELNGTQRATIMDIRDALSADSNGITLEEVQEAIRTAGTAQPEEERERGAA